MKTIEEMTAKECPALMGTIINIQVMEQKIMCSPTPFRILFRMTGEDLHNKQSELIPLYNESLKR